MSPGFHDEDLERIIFDLLEKPLNERVPSAAELLARLGTSSSGQEPATVSPAAQTSTHESRLRVKARCSWNLAIVSFLLLAGPYGLVAQAISLSGVYLFAKSQLAARWLNGAGWILLAWCVMGLAWGAIFFTPSIMAILGVPGDAVFLMILLAVPCNLIFGFSAFYFLSQARRIERELSLSEAISRGAVQREDHLAFLKKILEVRSDDVSLGQKYVESLMAGGRAADAVVESKLLLANDGYNVGGNLLLAQSYFDLGLYPQCAQVCEDYLRVTGYCFEFADLKKECQQRMEATSCIST